MTDIEYTKLITKFNLDKDVSNLKMHLLNPSFLEIISKQRSETAYSAFLKWLFTFDFGSKGGYQALERLLNIIALKRNIPLSQYIISGELKIVSASGETEKSIKGGGRLDIFIQYVYEVNEEKKEAEIIIENKIDSFEGLPPNGSTKYQTEQYFDKTHVTSKEQLYVYLTPEYSFEEPKCKEFVKVTYQDILTNIIIPLLYCFNMPSNFQMLLEQFKEELTFPNPEYSSIATDEETRKGLTEIWEKYQRLIGDAIVADKLKGKKGKTFYRIGNVYYDAKNWSKKDLCNLKQKRFKELEEEHKISAQKVKDFTEEITIDNKSYYISSKESGFVEKYVFKEYKSENLSILEKFVKTETNKNLLSSIFNALENSEKEKLSDLIALRYNVYYDGIRQNSPNKKSEAKPLDNEGLVQVIIKLWCDKINGGVPTFNKLVTDFPSSLNSNYKTRQLFYLESKIVKNKTGQWEGEDINGKKSILKENQDIPIGYTPNNNNQKYEICCQEGKAMRMMMWSRKSTLYLIKHAEKLFKDKLKVEFVYGSLM